MSNDEISFVFKLLYEHQYGFRSGRNTSQPLIQLINKIYQGLTKQTSEYTLGVFLTLKKHLTHVI